MIGIPLTYAIGGFIHTYLFRTSRTGVLLLKEGNYFGVNTAWCASCIMSRASTADLSLGVDSFNGRGELPLICACMRHEMNQHI
jgi:hypothetical protein